MPVSAEAIKAAAIERAGLSDFGDTFSEDAVQAWAKDLVHPRLNQTGTEALTRLMIGDLTRRLRIIDCLKNNPEINDVEVPPILYISGLERTGTTFLHNLLSLPDNARALRRWELMRPTPPPESETYQNDQRIAATQASIDKQRGTMLEQMHWVDADDPEECQWGMIDGSSILGAAVFPIMHNWATWYLQRDVETGFRDYRQVLKLLLWKNPIPQGGHLVLKCPQFSNALSEFSEEFPEARFAIMHRDPFRVAISLRTMLAGILSPFLTETIAPEQNPQFSNTIIERIESRVPLISAFGGRSEKVTNISYLELVASPAEVVRQVYGELGFSAPEDFAQVVEKFVQAQKAGKRAKPPKVLPTSGLSHKAFLSRPTIASYCEDFEITPEHQRQTGA